MGLRIVVDTNVLAAGLRSRRPSAANRVLRVALERQVQPLVGTALFAEYESVCSRRAPFRGSRLDAGERGEVLDAFLSVCEWVRIYYGWRPNLPDEGDNHLIELAVAGGAKAVVTKNTRHLRGGELVFEGLDICTPRRFLEEVGL